MGKIDQCPNNDAKLRLQLVLKLLQVLFCISVNGHYLDGARNDFNGFYSFPVFDMKVKALFFVIASTTIAILTSRPDVFLYQWILSV